MMRLDDVSFFLFSFHFFYLLHPSQPACNQPFPRITWSSYRFFLGSGHSRHVISHVFQKVENTGGVANKKKVCPFMYIGKRPALYGICLIVIFIFFNIYEPKWFYDISDVEVIRFENKTTLKLSPPIIRPCSMLDGTISIGKWVELESPKDNIASCCGWDGVRSD